MKQLRIATLGDYRQYYSYFLAGTMEGAIRCGAWFRPIQLLNENYGTIWEQIDFFKPHIMFCHCIFNRTPEGFRKYVFDILRKARKKHGTIVCYHMGDHRDTPRYPNDISDIVDIGLVNNAEADKWSNTWWKVPCYHWPYPCLYQKDIAAKDKRFAHGLVFTGLPVGRYHKHRNEFLVKLSSKLPVKRYPDEKWGNSRFLTAEVSASSTAVLGTQLGVNVRGYVDVRPFQYIGSGAIYMQDEHPNINMFFKPGEHYLTYERDSVSSIVESFDWITNNPALTKSIRRRGFDFCQKYHSTQARVQLVIDAIEGKEITPKLYLKDIKDA